jgi:YVTN family beta-propeller protein
MQNKTKLKKILVTGPLILFLLSLLFLFSGCPSAHNPTLYLTSSLKGNVYTFDLAENICSEDPVFDYGTDAGDGVFFYYARGYIASASFTDPRLVTFDPGESAPVVSTVSHTWVAGPWDLIAVRRTKAYVTDVGSYGENNGGVFYFNPEDIEPVFTKIAGSDANCQDMTYIPGRNKLYVANSGKGTVSVIDTITDKKKNEIEVGENPTEIVALSDGSRIYVICSNFYGKSSLVEIFTNRDTLGRTFTIAETAQASSIYGTKIYYTGVQDPFTTIVDIGPFYIDVGAGTPAETAVATTKPGGGNSLIHNGRLYITQPVWGPGQSTLTVIDLSNNSEIAGSPFDVGSDGDGIKGMAVY